MENGLSNNKKRNIKLGKLGIINNTKAYKIHLALLSFIKDEIEKKEKNFGNHMSITKRNNNIIIEENTNEFNGSEKSFSSDFEGDSSDMSGEEEMVI